MAYVELACRWVIVGVFLVAALTKVRSRASRDAFLSAVAALVPAAAPGPLGVLVVGIELAVAVLVALPWTVIPGLALAAGTLIVFGIAVWSALRRGVTVPCRCFGWSDAPVSRTHLVRNGVLVAIAATGLVARQAATAVGGAAVAGAAAPHAAGVAVSLAAAFVLVVVVTSLDDLAWLFLGRTSPSGRA
jgi:hypothetical protein